MVDLSFATDLIHKKTEAVNKLSAITSPDFSHKNIKAFNQLQSVEPTDLIHKNIDAFKSTNTLQKNIVVSDQLITHSTQSTHIFSQASQSVNQLSIFSFFTQSH